MQAKIRNQLTRGAALVCALWSGGCPANVTVLEDGSREDARDGEDDPGGVGSPEDPEQGGAVPASSWGIPKGTVSHPGQGYFQEVGDLACAGHDAVVAGDGRLLVVGDCLLHNTPVGAAVFDPLDETWVEVLGRAPTVGVTATLLQDGRVAIAGGAHLDGALEPSVHILEQGGHSLSQLESTIARQHHAAVVLPDGRLWLVGGSSPDRTTEFVCMSSGRVALGPELAAPRRRPALAWWDDAPLALGGAGQAGELVELVEESLSLQPWTPFAALVDSVGVLSVVASEGAILAFDDRSGMKLNDRGWVRLAKREDPLFSHTALRLDDGRVLFVGGGYYDVLWHLWIYDVSADAWLPGPGPETPSGWGNVTLSKLHDGRVMMIGDRARIWNPSGSD